MRCKRLYRVTQATSTPNLTPDAPASDHHTLLRTMGLFSLIVYGVGDMVGSGIYVTVGKAAGQMGNAVWLAFVVSMVAALLTGMSYASIASRYPRAAGAAYVTHRAFHLAFLSYVIGLAVTASGMTSMATSTRAFSLIVHDFTGVPLWLLIVLFLLFMTFVNFWGIRESMWTNLLCTAVEVGGLLFVIVIGMKYWGSVDYLDAATLRAVKTPDGKMTAEVIRTGLGFWPLLSASVLTFFAFVGFEDMLNISEEVKDPERTMPWGIVGALAVVTLIYIGTAVTAVSVVNYRDLFVASAPIESITQTAAPWLPRWVFKAITMFAVANTVLINYIMGSRLLYGMSRQGMLPKVLGRVHATRRTPHVAILALLVVVLVLAQSGQVQDLGAATGLLLLCCFTIVNGALIVLKLRPGEAKGKFEVPLVVPALGIVVNITLIVARLADGSIGRMPQVIAGALVVFIAILYFIMRPTTITEEALAQVEAES
jgi:basic amino acid/polyamine antiporter, APA family